jgi:hypothetical protein
MLQKFSLMHITSNLAHNLNFCGIAKGNGKQLLHGQDQENSEDILS